MPEYRIPVRPVEVDYRCDKCSMGHMRSVKMILETDDSVNFLHKCGNCGEEKTFAHKYPIIRYERQL